MNEINIETFPISIDTTDQIITYLNTQPHGDVVHLVSAIRNAYQAEANRIQASLNTQKQVDKPNKPKKETK